MSRRRLLLAGLVASVVAAAAVACSDASAPSATATADAGLEGAVELPPPSDDAGVDAAPQKPHAKPSFPTVVNRGGKTIAAPKVIPVVFAGDPLEGDITTFTKTIASSQFWKDDGAEYGVGPITPGDTIIVNETAPKDITSDGIVTWLKAKLTVAPPASTDGGTDDGGDGEGGTDAGAAVPEFGVPDANTLYAIYYPDVTSITMEGAGALGQSCQGYGGYHDEIDAGGTAVGYAVLPRCADLDYLTIAASHEYFEWATDPFPETKPAFSRIDDDHFGGWEPIMIGELGDVCTILDQSYIRPTGDYLMQRMWSNKLSLAGSFPCAPTKTSAYVQAVPDSPDFLIERDYQAQKDVVTKGIAVAPGKSRDVDMYIYSDQPDGTDIPLRVLPYTEFYHLDPSGFEFSISQDFAKAGDVITLTIKAPTTLAEDIVVPFAYVGKDASYEWPVLVTNDQAATLRADGQGAPPSTSLTLTSAKKILPRRTLPRGIRTTRLGMRAP